MSVSYSIETMLRRIALGLALMAIMSASAWAQPAQLERIEVRVLPQAEVLESRYTLGDIAEFDASDLKAVASLANLEIGRSPLPGRTLRISHAYIMARLNAQSGVLAKRVILHVPPAASVVRSAQRVRRAEIEQAVLEGARAFLPRGARDFRQEMVTRVNDLLLPLGKLSWNVEPMGKYLGTGGQRNYRVEATVNGESAWRSIIRVRQAVYQNILVTTRALGRNHRIADTDLALERRNMKNIVEGSYLTSTAAAIGKRTKRPLNRGEIVSEALIVAPMDVAEGGRVVLEFRSPGVTLRMPGVAMVSGKIGNFIPVRNLQSGKIVHGLLSLNDVVRVN